jgi:predicted DNA-binding ribbon-helix-helix protein
MMRKTMRIGPSLRTSIKLEREFWDYLKDLAGERSLRLTQLVNDVADAVPERSNLASTLRTFAIDHAKTRNRKLRQEIEQLSLTSSSRDLLYLLHMCPLPCVILDADRTIRQINRAFSSWLNIDPQSAVGRRLESVMVVRGSNLQEMWNCLSHGRMRSGIVNATYVSPGRVRTGRAVVLALTGGGAPDRRNCVLMFTLAGPGPIDGQLADCCSLEWSQRR